MTLSNKDALDRAYTLFHTYLTSAFQCEVTAEEYFDRDNDEWCEGETETQYGLDAIYVKDFELFEDIGTFTGLLEPYATYQSFKDFKPSEWYPHILHEILAILGKHLPAAFYTSQFLNKGDIESLFQRIIDLQADKKTYIKENDKELFW